GRAPSCVACAVRAPRPGRRRIPAMLLLRYGPEGFYAAGESLSDLRILHSDPLATAPSAWQFGRRIDLSAEAIRPPVEPGKLVGIGRNYREHAQELGNPVPPEPVVFLKSPGSVIGA